MEIMFFFKLSIVNDSKWEIDLKRLHKVEVCQVNTRIMLCSTTKKADAVFEETLNNIDSFQ